MYKRIAAAALGAALTLVLAQPAAAQDRDYRLYARDENVNLMDVGSIKRSGDLVEVRTFVIFDPEKVEDGAYYGEVTQKVDCRKRQLKLTLAREWDLQGKLLHEVPLDQFSDWAPLRSGTLGGEILRVACSGKADEMLDTKIEDPFAYGREVFAKTTKPVT